MRFTAAAERVPSLLRPVCYRMTKIVMRPVPCVQVPHDRAAKVLRILSCVQKPQMCLGTIEMNEFYCHAIIIARQKTHVCQQPKSSILASTFVYELGNVAVPVPVEVYNTSAVVIVRSLFQERDYL